MEKGFCICNLFVTFSAFELCMYNRNLKCQERKHFIYLVIYYITITILVTLCTMFQKKVITFLLVNTIKTWVFP